jgi:hypothetical protein
MKLAVSVGGNSLDATEEKRHCAFLAAKTLQAALESYMQKKPRCIITRSLLPGAMHRQRWHQKIYLRQFPHWRWRPGTTA